MAVATAGLTLAEFHAQYGNEHGYEYWFGEAVRKGMPTWLHSVLQLVLGEMFRRLGYKTGSELELRIDPNWQPRPEIVAVLQMDEPYPTKPVDIVAEILSDDPMTRVFEKCRNYARIGIGQIFVFDPESKTAWQWSRETENLERFSTVQLGNGATLNVDEVWAELEARK